MIKGGDFPNVIKLRNDFKESSLNSLILFLQKSKKTLDNLYHINALYNLLDKRYVDAVIQPCKKSNEYNALYTMVDMAQKREKAIVIADRGFESYNALAHIENKGWNDLIRLKNTASIVKKLDIPDTDEFDVDFKLLLTGQSTKEILSHPEKYRTIMTNTRRK